MPPSGQGLRNAIVWLSDQGRHDATAVQEAAVRFDLSPLDEEFLLRHLAGVKSGRDDT